MKIFDCFTFLNEIELLELRLMELGNLVDYFIIVEANKTFTGNPKEFIFENNKKKFQEYLPKIIYLKVKDLPNPDPQNVWNAEYYQRNAIMRGLEGKARKGDKILVSDVDEIPSKKAIIENINTSHRVIFKQSFYYYYVNCRVSRNWGGTVMDTFGNFPSPQNMRESAKRHGVGVYPGGGWHYSYLTGGDPDKIIYKCKNIVHYFDNLKIGTKKDVIYKLKNLKDIYGRGNRFSNLKIIDIDNDKPESMDRFLNKFPQFFYKNG